MDKTATVQLHLTDSLSPVATRLVCLLLTDTEGGEHFICVPTFVFMLSTVVSFCYNSPAGSFMLASIELKCRLKLNPDVGHSNSNLVLVYVSRLRFT